MSITDSFPFYETKQCSCCHQVLPVTRFEFHQTGSDGRRSKCKGCRAEQVKRTKDRWINKNRAKVNAYANRYAAAKRALRLKPEPCPKGHTVFKWKLGQWYCTECSRIAAKERSKRTERLRDRERNILRWAKLYETEFGPAFAQAYLALVNRQPTRTTNRRLVEVIRLMLPVAYRKFRLESVERIYQMNRLLNLPIWNIGWTCQRCATYSADFRFFDIDHITPVHKKGHGRLSNKQVLCPNCHRRKTIVDVHGSVLDPDFLTTDRTKVNQHRSDPVLAASGSALNSGWHASPENRLDPAVVTAPSRIVPVDQCATVAEHSDSPTGPP